MGVMTSLTSAVLVAAALATGWVAGVLGHYAHTLIPALRRVDDRTFVTAFQAIDRAILNPWFMVAFSARRCWQPRARCWPGATPTGSPTSPPSAARSTSPVGPRGTSCAP